MGNLNRVELIGRLCGDPELRYTQGGKPVGNFSLATNESWKDKDGERQEKTEFHRCVLWNKTAEFAAQYLAKGREVFVEGKLQTRQWEDAKGEKRWTTEIVVANVQPLGPKPGERVVKGEAHEEPAEDNGEPLPF